MVSAAERQRQYRARRDADPVKKAANLRKDRERWKKRRDAGSTSTVATLSDREQRHKRKYWREAQQRCRARKQRTVQTTPQSPDPVPDPEPDPEPHPEPGTSLWYPFDDVLRIIPQPTQVTGRHVEIDKAIWSEMIE